MNSPPRTADAHKRRPRRRPADAVLELVMLVVLLACGTVGLARAVAGPPASGSAGAGAGLPATAMEANLPAVGGPAPAVEIAVSVHALGPVAPVYSCHPATDPLSCLGLTGGGGGGSVGSSVQDAIDGWIGSLAQGALQAVLGLIGATLLASPQTLSDGRIFALWHQNLLLADACYGLLIVIGGMILAGHETVQSRYGLKQIAPRLVVGFLAGTCSLWIIPQAIAVANALAQALIGTQVPAQGLGNVLLGLLYNPLLRATGTSGLVLGLIGIGAAVIAVLLLIVCIARITVLILLTVAAPLALSGHALPQTEAVAYWWWRALAACLGIQVAQALILDTLLATVIDPHAFDLLGLPTGSGVIDMLVGACLLYLLLIIPRVALNLALGRPAGRPGMVGSLLRPGLVMRGLFVAGLGGVIGRRGPRGGGGPTAAGGGPAGGGPGPGGGGAGGGGGPNAAGRYGPLRPAWRTGTGGGGRHSAPVYGRPGVGASGRVAASVVRARGAAGGLWRWPRVSPGTTPATGPSAPVTAVAGLPRVIAAAGRAPASPSSGGSRGRGFAGGTETRRPPRGPQGPDGPRDTGGPAAGGGRGRGPGPAGGAPSPSRPRGPRPAAPAARPSAPRPPAVPPGGSGEPGRGTSPSSGPGAPGPGSVSGAARRAPAGGTSAAWPETSGVAGATNARRPPRGGVWAPGPPRPPRRPEAPPAPPHTSPKSRTSRARPARRPQGGSGHE